MKASLSPIIFLVSLAPAAVMAAELLPSVDVYKSASCDCCVKWIAHLKANGFEVTAHDVDNPVEYKYRLRVPPGMGSCHTAKVGDYVVEGHVPAREIKRLLREHSQARGLAVPAMPMGSPGMEGPRSDPYDVLLIQRDGSVSRYATY